MGLFDFIFGSSTGSDPKTRVSDNGEKITVRNSDVVFDHNSGKHETAWSKTEVDTRTGDSKTSEGAHGSNYQK
ncbi:MAG: hypothetical protein WDK96_01155 [Candidatus Paceibacterota bacterium]|jgi:hypothetical protein